jgi:hypothetical protein
MSTKRKKAYPVKNEITGPRTAIDVSGLDADQRRRVANTRHAGAKAKMKKRYDNNEVTVGNKTKLQRRAMSEAGEAGSKANAVARLHRSANNAQTELKNSERIKNRERVAKKKKEAAENKEPLNYGTAMNYSMKPGSREVDTPGAFRDTSINKHMGAPVNYGTEGGDDKKKVAGKKAAKKKSASKKAPRGPQNISVGGVKARMTTKGRSEKNTDLLEEGKKVYRKVKKYLTS